LYGAAGETNLTSDAFQKPAVSQAATNSNIDFSLPRLDIQPLEKQGYARMLEKMVVKRRYPPMAQAVAQKLKGRKIAPEKLKSTPEILEQFKPMFEEIGKQVASMKAVNRNTIPKLLLWQQLEEQRKKEKQKKEKQKKKARECPTNGL